MIASARISAILVGLMVVAGCSSGGSTGSDATRPSDLEIVEEADWAALFDESGVVGTFALHQLGTDEVIVHDAARATERAIPASTFKILNSLIALETGAVSDVDELVPWDGVERSFAAWNRDHSLRTGIEVSAVWAYQHLAREVGTDQMSALVAAAEYGNADIGGTIDEFWLQGDLRISPIEQLDMLSRLMTDELPFEPRHQAAVREIVVREEGEGWVWGHKTGTALAAQPVLGWLVGYTDFEDATWVFAMNIDLGDVTVDTQIDPEVRQSLSRAILEAAGALPSVP